MKSTALLTTSIGSYPKRSGKVRDIYELPDGLLMVATDRISAYDVVMPNGIHDKGRVLTQSSDFWFNLCKVLGEVYGDVLVGKGYWFHVQDPFHAAQKQLINVFGNYRAILRVSKTESLYIYIFMLISLI